MTKSPRPIPIRAEMPSASGKFARACFAVAQGHVFGGGRNEVARFLPPNDPVVPLIVHRSVAAPGASTR